MASKPFVSARVPQHIADELEALATATGESKTDIIIDALSEHLGIGVTKNNADSNLDRRLRQFEYWVMERLQGVESRIDDIATQQNAVQEHQTATMESLASLPASPKPMPRRLMASSSSKSGPELTTV